MQTPADNAAPGVVPTGRARLKRFAYRAGRTLLVAYLVTAMVLFFAQDWLIFPGARTQGTAAARMRPAAGEELLQLKTSRGDTVYVLFGGALTPTRSPHPLAASRPTLIFFYGNGMSMADAVSEFDAFRQLGANVAVVEYPGYGMSSGRPGEAAFYAAADAAYEAITRRADIDPKQIIPTGWSIGGGPAIDMAHRHPVAGVATFSAFTSLPDMAHHLLPMFPTKWLLRHRFENERKLRDLAMPTFLAHGTQDSIVPFPMEAALAKAAKGKVTLVEVQGGDHNDVFEVGGRELLDAFGGFIEQVHVAAAGGRPKEEKVSPTP